jgi:aromatic ring-opening dioxygenase LigB subunit
MAIDLKYFGFIPPKTILNGDSLLADQLKNALSAEPDLKVQLVSQEIIDYGSAIPAYLLKNTLENFKLLIISPATEKPLEEQLLFGQKIKEVITSSEKNVALIISGDLSHRLKKKSPAGYSPKGAKFDNRLIEYLNDPENTVSNILKMDKKLIAEAGECGLRPLMVALGILDGIKWMPEVLAYQTDFGIGYLSLNFKL